MIKAKIYDVVDEYLVSNPLFFVEGGQNGHFHLKFRAKLHEGKNDSIIMFILHRDW